MLAGAEMSHDKDKTSSHPPKVAIIMGSDSDFGIMKDAALALSELDLSFDIKVVSAHRTPSEMMDFAKAASSHGYSVIIAGAGGAAHLPGMVAALTIVPVIGVPIPNGPLNGQDALLSIVQMPKGVPVATVAIGNAYNAGLLAAQILASGTDKAAVELKQRLEQYRSKMREASLAKVVRFEKP